MKTNKKEMENFVVPFERVDNNHFLNYKGEDETILVNKDYSGLWDQDFKKIFEEKECKFKRDYSNRKSTIKELDKGNTSVVINENSVEQSFLGKEINGEFYTIVLDVSFNGDYSKQENELASFIFDVDFDANINFSKLFTFIKTDVAKQLFDSVI